MCVVLVRSPKPHRFGVRYVQQFVGSLLRVLSCEHVLVSNLCMCVCVCVCAHGVPSVIMSGHVLGLNLMWCGLIFVFLITFML